MSKKLFRVRPAFHSLEQPNLCIRDLGFRVFRRAREEISCPGL